MAILNNKINNFLNNKKLTLCNLGKLMSFSEGALYDMVQKRRPFSENAIKKLLPILEISREEFESWVVADKYPKEVLKHAIQTKKEFPYKRKSILTTKIDTILQEKSMSRTDLSKEIKYSQSGLNRMIIGQINMSKSVLERISTVLEIPEKDLHAWIVADKYSLQLLEQACTLI